MIFNNIKQVPKENQLNIACYYRYSSDKQTENSIDGQRRECKKYAAAHGFNIVNEYIDKAASGTNDNREAFQKMIEDAKKQQFAFILVYRFDRFARNRYDSAIYKKKLEQYGIKVISATENIGTGDEGIILESIYEAMDEAYSRRLSRITKRGMKETALKGLWTGGYAPFGFMVVEHKLVINEYEAEGIKLACSMLENGETTKNVTDKLFNLGIRARNGKKITTCTLRHILANPVITGERAYQDIIVKNDSIITKEQFEKVNLILSTTKKKVGKPPEEDFFHLSGKLFCGECGTAMVGDSGTSRSGEKHYYYTCSKRKKERACKKKSEKKDFIEWYVCEQTVKNVLTDKRIEKIAKLVITKQEEDNNSNLITQAEKELKRIDKEYNKLTDAFINCPTESMAEKIKSKCLELEENKESLENELAKLKLLESIKITEKDVIEYLNLFKNGDLFDKEFRKKLIKTLINCVYLYDDKIVIYFNLKNSKTINYIDVIKDIDELIESHPDVFEQLSNRGANNRKSRTQGSAFFVIRPTA